MTEELQNIEVAKRFINQGIAKANMKVFDDILDPNITVTTGLSPAASIQGIENYKQIFSSFADAWPVKHFVIDDIFGVNHKVVVRFTATSVFKKDYYDVKATNQIVPLKEVHILTFRNGKIVENIVSATNFPFEYIMYPVLKDAVIGNLEIDI
ncbi:MAG: ester cyclase [Brasilonema octagenarum HA4186-MV1]|uniref:Nuclear transport factor 2 family protein n=1 Tax=Brasilonema octagenarum UFV-OR1 TaxID=417115 RepID=A0ABX1MAI0_9CYAN|nr:ester cyclase [Brasilonema octagenarum]MBW4627785.1 ester cyclase [Brasilonema octagenarum HA4186-MV1]NMF63819.1 nuclear transport factor 2 family protein [Brasilonema octagenarum UFV-OR1]